LWVKYNRRSEKSQVCEWSIIEDLKKFKFVSKV